MGFLKNIFSNTAKEAAPTVSIQTDANTVYAPFQGTVIPLEEIGDGVFSSGVLGQGIGMKPDEETVYAPFDGKIVQIAETKHAIGILSNDNVELLIHVGMDTVAMNGKGFDILVSEGDTVRCGQKLMTFSKKAIADAGYPDTTAIVVTNSADFSCIKPLTGGSVEKLTPVLLAE